jgi:hypothetical protein
MLNYFVIFNIFELFVTKNIVPNFCGKKFPVFARAANEVLTREISFPAYVR